MSLPAAVSGGAHALVGLLLAVATAACAADPLPPRDVERETITLAFGGDVNLGAEMHQWTAGPSARDLLRSLEPIRDADLAVVNLETVVATTGSAVDKPREKRPFHFRARPETVSVLTAAGVDAVVTANNHAGDYGPEALMEQGRILDASGIRHAGSGRTLQEACEPLQLSSKGISVAIFSVDATEPVFAATDERPGTCSLPGDDEATWRRVLGPLMAAARTRADAVLVAVSWGENFVEDVSSEKQRLGRALVELGADAVLGTNAHRLQGIGTYDGRPILYDVSHLLFDFDKPVDSAIFELRISAAGVERVTATPVVAEKGTTRLASGEDRVRILATLARLSAELDTTVDGGTLILDPPERDAIAEPAEPVGRAPSAPTPAAPAAPQCMADVVPEADRVPPTRLGPVELVGFDAPDGPLDGPGPLRVATYWRLADPTAQAAAGVYISPTATPTSGPAWSSPHEPCDWAWPADRWEPGTIYRDEYLLRPSPAVVAYRGVPALLGGIADVTLDLGVVVRQGDEEWRAEGLGSLKLTPSIEAVVIVTAAVGAALLAIAGAVAAVGHRRRRRAR